MSARSRASRRRRPLTASLLGALGIAATLLLVLPEAPSGANEAAPAPAPAPDASGDDGPTNPVIPFGAAPDLGGPPQSAGFIAGVAATPTGTGYWVVTTGGQVHTFGTAADHGSSPGASRVVDVVAARGGGYWVAREDGSVSAHGGARDHGRPGALAHPVVGMAATPSGGGYWLVASDGGVFAHGDARFAGSTGAVRLNSPIVGMAAAPDGGGYWLVAADGGVFSFGSAVFHGSLGAGGVSSPVVSMAAAPDGGGYWLASRAGEVRAFGSAKDHGSVNGGAPSHVADLTVRPNGDGYWLATGGEIVVRAASASTAEPYEPARSGEPSDADFDRLAECESSGRWNLNTGNGYYGGLQFSASTWRYLGGTGLPHEHSREVQIEMGRRQWRKSGWQAWPTCRRTAGLG
jgi:hypothetical protein